MQTSARIEEAWVGQQQDRGLALALDLGRAEIESAVTQELGKRLGGFFARQQHRVAEMQAAGRIGEELIAQDALVDLNAFLLRLAQLRFGGDFGPRRRQAGHDVGGLVDQAFETHELPPPVGQPVVERACMRAQEKEARRARGLLERFGGLPVQLFPGSAPVGGEGGHVGREVAGGRDRRRNHRIHAEVPA